VEHTLAEVARSPYRYSLSANRLADRSIRPKEGLTVGAPIEVLASLGLTLHRLSRPIHGPQSLANFVATRLLI
jgi:hypothetical protein